MGETKWTASQRNVIDSEGGTLLVSAAAGSGKTTVMVEKITRMILEGKCSVRDILVVTFTNAAAANMKAKIAKSLAKAARENRENKNLVSELNCLPLARISTIDSFCIDLVRSNFHALDIEPDFALMDGGKEKILRNEAINSVLDEYYEKNPENFSLLCDTISGDRDDNNLIEAALKIYDEAQSHPFPDEYLDSLTCSYTDTRPFLETPMGKILLAYLKKAFDYYTVLADKAMKLAENELLSESLSEKHAETIKDVLLPIIRKERECFYDIKDNLYNTDWDGLKEKIEKLKFDGFPRMNNKSPEMTQCKSMRDEWRDSFKDDLQNLFGETQEEINDNKARILPVIQCLTEFVRDFSKKYSEAKRAQNAMTFGDILHCAINLLSDRDENGKLVKSAVAKELSDEIKYIFVDEYQDVNEAQELLFNLLSAKGDNLFMVGDVKQSIYGFRQARPELFLKKQNEYARYDGKTYPSTILLGENFRSRKGITENVNHIFSRIMTNEIGGLEYNSDHFLNYHDGAYEDKTEPDVELHHCLYTDKKTKKYEAEAEFIADYIESNVGKMLVKEKDGQRPARYGDFCVLMRSVKDEGVILSALLEKRNIPASCKMDRVLFEEPEVRFVLALLRVLNNPADDVSLLAVMLSPVYGFTPDEMIDIKNNGKNRSLFRNVVIAAENGDSKCSSFLEETDKLRKISFTVGAAELLQILYEKTGYISVVSAMGNAAGRRTNLRLLCDYAEAYESAGRFGLSGFLRYIDRAEKTEEASKMSEPETDSADSVKIMTIHKSKGLEFPVCILARCSTQFSRSKGGVVYSHNCGIGLYASESKYVRINNIMRETAKIDRAESERAEELRCLYVAMTRAMEKLVIITTDVEGGRCTLNLCDYSDSEKLMPFAVLKATTPADLIFTAFSDHPDAPVVRTLLAKNGREHLITVHHGKAPLLAQAHTIEKEEAEETEEEEIVPDVSQLVELIREKIDYKYEYACLDGARAKRVASDFAEAHSAESHIAEALPAFMSKNGLTPAQRGTANHKFMELADFSDSDIEAQLERFVEEGKLTSAQAQAVDKEKMRVFFESDICRRIRASSEVYREKPFTCEMTAGEIYPGVTRKAADETVIIEGVADIAFVENGKLGIVDYKTDYNVTKDKLRLRYSGQLGIYAQCLEKTLGIEVKETCIYSFFLGETVKI